MCGILVIGDKMKEQYGDLVLIYSNKEDGNMSKKYGEEADSNRQKFIRKMGLEVNRFLLMQADNQDRIVELKEEVETISDLYYKLVEADAIICKYSNVFLYLNFGDCIPFTIYDRKNHVFGFAHLGWRSTHLDLHQKLFHVFKEQFHSSNDDLFIHIGPCIKKDSYLLPSPIQREEEKWKPYIDYVRDDLYSVDLCGYVRDFFLESELLESQIKIVPIDTGADMNYFSHYRSVEEGEKEGRFFFGVGME